MIIPAMCPCRRGDIVNTYDRETLAFYETEAPVYNSSRPDGVARHLPEFLNKLPARASILELGCGGGRDAAYMIERGFIVDPTDGAAAMAAQAESRLGRTVRLLRFDQLNADSHYDAVVATASLLHVPRIGLPDVLRRIHNALKPDGQHIATYKGGGIEGRDINGRYYNYPSPNELEQLYQVSGKWSDIEIEEYIGGGYFGKQGPWLKIIARKAT
jgi:SAM-dependent methyltransferase